MVGLKRAYSGLPFVIFSIFTFHYGRIKTEIAEILGIDKSKFTFHYGRIKTKELNEMGF